MSENPRRLANDTQGYDAAADTWFGFNTPEQAAMWVAETEPSPDYRETMVQRVTVNAAPAFNAFNIGVTCAASPVLIGPTINLAQGDEGRTRLLVCPIIPAGSYLLVGTREAVIAGQGFAVPTGVVLELQNVRMVWGALALGSATGPITGLVSVLTESLVG